MKRTSTIVVSLLVAFLLFEVFRAPTAGQGAGLQRLSAEFRNFNGGETSTTLPIPGISAYSKSLAVPGGVNTLFVTISTTVDTHGGVAALFSCNVDGVFCNPGNGFAAPAGWIALSKHFNYDSVTYNGGVSGGDGRGGNGDMHDNNVYYTWCTAVTPGNHTVEIRLASSDDGGGSFQDPGLDMEASHFYIDAASLPDRCGA
jgi:hypothetical protein